MNAPAEVGSDAPSVAAVPAAEPAAAKTAVKAAATAQANAAAEAKAATKATAAAQAKAAAAVKAATKAAAAAEVRAAREAKAAAKVASAVEASRKAAESPSPVVDLALIPLSNRNAAGSASDAYIRERAMARVGTAVQRRALERLKKNDVHSEAHFTAPAVLDLVRSIEAEAGKLRHLAAVGRKSKWLCDLPACCGIIGVAVALIVGWMLVLAFANIARESRVDASGTLVNADGHGFVATGRAMTLHSFKMLRSLADGDLRRIVDCTFVHSGAYLTLQVASIVRSPDGELRLTSPGRIVLHIPGDESGNVEGPMLQRPLHAKELVEFSVPNFPWLPFEPDAVGCRVAAMGDALNRKSR